MDISVSNIVSFFSQLYFYIIVTDLIILITIEKLDSGQVTIGSLFLVIFLSAMPVIQVIVGVSGAIYLMGEVFSAKLFHKIMDTKLF